MGETARKFGYDIPLAGCFEYTSRAERDLGAQRHAEWYARDMLIGLAFRFPTISPAGIEDVGNCYYDTLWGASGLCQRTPRITRSPPMSHSPRSRKRSIV